MVRLGFLEADQALAAGVRLGAVDAAWADRVARLCAAAADPDQALAVLADLSQDIGPELARADPAAVARLVAVAGASAELGRWLVRHPDEWEALAGEPVRAELAAIRADLARALTAAAPADGLRQAWRRQLGRIAARDLTAADPAALVESIGGELADLADATVQVGLDIARAATPQSDQVRLAVIALGKTGAQELNYLSDVDLIYLAEPALDATGQPVCQPDQAIVIATKVVAALTQAVSGSTAAGSIWAIDANLRPEGAAGPLVRSLAAMERYYRRWAQNWEFQAMLKARPIAGDPALGQAFLDLVRPLVWQAAQRPGFVAAAQAMRQRVVDHIPAKEVGREIKLGPGGLRDTEFSVQLLQLVHGRTDDSLRLRPTLPALAALVAGGYIGRADGAVLDRAYRFQRLLEHRLQLWRLRRTHLMPEAHDQAGLRRLARSVGLATADEVAKRWRDSTRAVERLHLRVFYSPLLAAVARLPTDEARLTSQAARERLRALGYGDPPAALRHIGALTAGLSRRAAIQRQLLPALLGWMAAGPNPDMGLLAFRQLSDTLGNSPFYLRALRDEGATAQRLAKVLSTSRYVANLLRRSPEAVELLAHDSVAPPKRRAVLVAEMTAVVGHHDLGAGSGAALRAVRRRELLRVAMSDLLAEADIRQVARELSDIADASLEAALQVARRQIPGAPGMALIALGRWGGGEMSYASDVDLVCVVQDGADPEALRAAGEVVTALRRLLKVPGPDPDLELDFDLRPEGKDGPVVRTLASHRAYYQRWSSPWEAQALIRARPGAGDLALGQAWIAAVNPRRYPDGGLSAEQLLEIRRLKTRMEAERLPRGRVRDHVKLGPGGLADVEWTVQLLQLQHAWELPALRVTGTLDALDVARQAGLVSADDARDLAAAWLLASRLRNAVMLLRDVASDMLPADAVQAGQVAEILGYGKSQASQLAEDWGQAALRSRKVVDRLFWGQED